MRGPCSSARNLENSEKVAIKKITNAFENIIDAKRTLREVKLLRHLTHENVIQIKDIIPPTTRVNFKDVYVVYELMDTVSGALRVVLIMVPCHTYMYTHQDPAVLTMPWSHPQDLHQIIRSPQPLSDDHCQYFLYQASAGAVGSCLACTRPSGRACPKRACVSAGHSGALVPGLTRACVVALRRFCGGSNTSTQPTSSTETSNQATCS